MKRIAPLEEQAIALGICPTCHEKTLEDEMLEDGRISLYCPKCKTETIVEPEG